MRILFLTHQYFPRHVGGTEMLVRGLASQMRSRGHEVAVLAYVETPGTELHDFGFRVSEFEGAPLWELHYNLACAANPAEAEFDNPFIAGLVAHAAGEIKPDVVHAMHLMKLSAAVLPRLKQMGIPVVATLCDFWPICLRHTLLLPEGDICQTGPDHPMRCLRCAQVTHGFAKTTNDESELALWQRAEAALADAAFPEPEFRCDVAAITTRTERIRSAFLMADRLLALTEFQRLLFVRHGFPEASIEVCPIGIETAPLEQTRLARQSIPPIGKGDTKRIVFISPLAQHKGLHVLMEALQRVQDPRLELHVYGGPGPDAAYIARIREAAMGDPRVTLHGVVPPDEIGNVLIDASVLALPVLWYQNDPLIVKTALYCGVRVAASRIGGLAKQLSDPGCGWLLPSGNVEEWAQWLQQLANSTVTQAAPASSVIMMKDYAEQMERVYLSVLK